QYRRPFVSGDWVRIGNHLGRVVGTGWRATWILSRNNEQVQIPNALLSTTPVINYTAGGGMVADEIYIDVDREETPERIEKIVSAMLHDNSEVHRAEVDLWEYQGPVSRYRIRYWLRDYAGQERIRIAITRNLWYTLRRNSIELAAPTQKVLADLNGKIDHSVPTESAASIPELRRVYLL